MYKSVGLVLMLCATFVSSPCQMASSKYQVGTIFAVTRHPSAADTSDTKYDVSIKVGDTLFVVLYSPSNSANTVEYATGTEILVLVGDKTLAFPNKFQGTTEVPILRTEALASKPTIDWSKAPGQYFSMKMQNLTEELNLTDEQQVKIKPIAQQESGEVSEVCFTPTIPRKERLDRFEKIVRSGDAKMKRVLSQDQWLKLQQLRKEQKQELKKIIADQAVGSNS